MITISCYRAELHKANKREDTVMFVAKYIYGKRKILYKIGEVITTVLRCSIQWTRIPFYRRDVGVRDRIPVGPSRGSREAILGAKGRDSLSSRYSRGRVKADRTVGRTWKKGGWEEWEEKRKDGIFALKERTRIA